MKLQVKDEYSNGHFIRFLSGKAQGFGDEAALGWRYLGHTWTRVQPRATHLILPCIALSAGNRISEERRG